MKRLALRPQRRAARRASDTYLDVSSCTAPTMARVEASVAIWGALAKG